MRKRPVPISRVGHHRQAADVSQPSRSTSNGFIRTSAAGNGQFELCWSIALEIASRFFASGEATPSLGTIREICVIRRRCPCVAIAASSGASGRRSRRLPSRGPTPRMRRRGRSRPVGAGRCSAWRHCAIAHRRQGSSRGPIPACRRVARDLARHRARSCRPRFRTPAAMWGCYRGRGDRGATAILSRAVSSGCALDCRLRTVAERRGAARSVDRHGPSAADRRAPSREP